MKKNKKSKSVKSKKRFFSIKMYFIQEASPTKKVGKSDGNNKKAIGLEERVIIYQSKDMSSAVKLALKDAKKYQKMSYVNLYGEKIKCTFTGYYDGVELLDKKVKPGLVFGILDVFLSHSKLLKSLKSRHYPQRKKFVDIMSKKFAPK